MESCREASRCFRLSSTKAGELVHAVGNACGARSVPGPGVQCNKGSHSLASTEHVSKLGDRQAYGPNSSGSMGWGAWGSWGKGPGLGTKPYTKVFYVLGQVSPFLGLHFPHHLKKKMAIIIWRLRLWSPRFLSARML